MWSTLTSWGQLTWKGPRSSHRGTTVRMSAFGSSVAFVVVDIWNLVRSVTTAERQPWQSVGRSTLTTKTMSHNKTTRHSSHTKPAAVSTDNQRPLPPQPHPTLTNTHGHLARKTHTRADRSSDRTRTPSQGVLCAPDWPLCRLHKNNREEIISLSQGGRWRWMRCPCSHWYLICGASYTCHLFDVTVATGAEGGTLGTGVAVHLPINFHGLSERKEKNRENVSTQESRKRFSGKPNNKGCGSVRISFLEHDML